MQILEQHSMKIGQVMQALRLAITGLEAGPDLMAIIEIIGPDETATPHRNSYLEKLQA